jgi:hypothetical protein
MNVHSRCEGCLREIDPEAPDTIQLREQVKTVAMGRPTITCADGPPALFHPECFPPNNGKLYRPAERVCAF